MKGIWQICWKDKRKKDIYFGMNENLLHLLCWHVFWLKLCLHKKYSIQNYVKYKNKNRIIKTENMLSMQAEKSSSGQMFRISDPPLKNKP